MLQLTNNLSGKKENFKQLKQGEVSMYVCGVTLYDNIHIGHLKSILTFEVLRNYFLLKKQKVTLVRNITDIDDKIIKKALELGRDPLELVNEYVDIYHKLLEQLEIKKPDIEPRVTQYLEQIIQYVENSEPGSIIGIGTEIHLVNRLAKENTDKTIVSLDPLYCPCSTMFRIDRPHLAWTIENIVNATPVNEIRVDERTREYSRISLQRMLDITNK